MVSKAVAERRAELKASLEITQDRVLREFAAIAFLDIRKFFTKQGALLPVHDLGDLEAAAVASLEAEGIYEGKGADRTEVGRLTKIKLSDKLSALNSLAKHLGMFVDRHEISGADQGPLWVHFEECLDKAYGGEPTPEMCKIGPQTQRLSGNISL
jgi:phage terminase small subunit